MTPPVYTYNHFEHLLDAAQANSWRFAPFDDPALETPAQQSDERICLLRHDCDHDMAAALRMADREAARGVKATYFLMVRTELYNIFSATNRDRAKRIFELGHYAGLHFDEHVYGEVSDTALIAAIDRERAWVEGEFGVSVPVVSFHQPSRRVLEQQVRPNCINTYDRAFFGSMLYRSDSNHRLHADGDPSPIFSDPAVRRLHLLLHPELWTDDDVDIDEKWRRMMAQALVDIENNLATREDAYTQRHKVSLTPEPRRDEDGQ